MSSMSNSPFLNRLLSLKVASPHASTGNRGTSAFLQIKEMHQRIFQITHSKIDAAIFCQTETYFCSLVFRKPHSLCSYNIFHVENVPTDHPHYYGKFLFDYYHRPLLWTVATLWQIRGCVGHSRKNLSSSLRRRELWVNRRFSSTDKVEVDG